MDQLTPIHRPTALITGASSGIGRDLARLFAQDGYNLALVARSADRLEELASKLIHEFGITARVFAQDLAKPGSAQELFQELRVLSDNPGKDPEIDVLVNNAGFGSHGPFKDIPLITHQRMMQLNMVTLTELTALILPEMLRRKKGRILNVASVAAYQPGPMLAVYYASKAYVLSFSEALANELQGSGVTVTALCPGPTRTEFMERAGMSDLKVLKNAPVMSSLPVAREGFRGMMRGKPVVIPGALNKIMVFSTRFASRKLTARVVAHLNEKP